MAEKFVLVTGGAGFIGTHLCRRLAKDGEAVVSLDNYFTGRKENHIPGVEYREGHTKDIATLVPETPALVYHLGEYSRVEQSFHDARKVFDLNTIGTINVLEYCKEKNVKIVYAGSSTKFGDGGLGRNQSPYAWTKASNTELVRNYGLWYNLPYAITYFYNVYGPGEISNGPYATLIGLFLEKYKKGHPLTVVSPGTQRRCFTYIDDIIEGLIRVGKSGEGDDFGIGNERSFSVLEVAKLFNTEVVMLPPRAGNRMDSSIDTAKTKALGWSAKHELEKYIRTQISPEKQTKKAKTSH